MMLKGMDGLNVKSRKISQSATRWYGRQTIGAVCLCALLMPGMTMQVDAQDAPTTQTYSNGSSMQATLQQVDNTSEAFELRAGTSTVVETNVPIRRASVGAPELVDVRILSPREVLITGKSAGRTQLILWDENDDQLIFDINITPDLAILRQAIARTAKGAEVEVEAVADTIVITGKVADTDQADRIMQIAGILATKVTNQMVVAGEQQVLLRCTFAEVDKRATRQLGVNGWLAGSNVPDVFAVSQIGGINPVNIGGAPVGNIRQGIPIATDKEGLVLSPTPDFSLGFTKTQLQLFFKAMRRNNLMRIMAEPNLIALNGHEANFLAGGEFPVPVAQGNGAVGVEYKDFGVILKFRPTVIGRQMIRLNVGTEVSEIDTSTAVSITGYTVPGLTKRQANTTIEISSGTTIAIAGLLNEQIRGLSQRLPGLGDIPVLGSLFASSEYQRSLTELVVLVTPELVNGMNPNQVVNIPGSEITEPNDWQLYGLGMIEGEPMTDAAGTDAALKEDTKLRFKKYSSSPDQTSLHGPWGAAEQMETLN